MKTTKIWLGVGVAIVTGAAPAAADDSVNLLGTTAVSGGAQSAYTARATAPAAAKIPLGEGGENESGESGEGGIDAAAADKDPVKYGIALQVIAAHYHAGMAAYEAGETAAGTQMFAHGHAEVFAEMEDVFKKRGVHDLGARIEAAVAAASRKVPPAELRKIVEQVYAALAAAEKAGPKSALTPLTVKARVVADMLDRAAAQYVLVLKKDSTLETYLDGLGFAVAARTEAAAILPQLEKIDPAAAKAIGAALDAAGAAYPGVKRSTPADVSKFLAAASAARIATARLR